MKGQFAQYLFQRVVLQTALVIAVVAVGFLVVGGTVWRLDLTEDNRFSISEASHELAANLEDPLTIRCYFSGELPPRLHPFEQQVFDILSEYEAHSGGRIKIERFDPIESKTAQSEAQNYGVRPVGLQIFEAAGVQVQQAYGGIVLIYRDKASEVINVAERFNQGYEGLAALEYEVSSRIWQLINERPKIGLTGYMSTEAQRNPFGPPQPPRNEFQGMRRILGESFELKDVDFKTETVDPEKVPLVLIVRPRNMSDVEIFRLDQYLMKGGRVLIFMTQGTIQVGPMTQNRFTYQRFKTGLDGWLKHHGLRVPNEFVLQASNCNEMPIEVSTPIGKVQLPRPNYWWPVVFKDGLDKENPAIRTLRSINFYWCHPIDILESQLTPDKTATALVRSMPNESWRWKDLTRIDLRQFTRADSPRNEDLRESNMAVALEGTFTSYFSDRPVPPSLLEVPEDNEKDEKDEGEEGDEEKKDDKPKAPGVVKSNDLPTQLVVLGNSLFISDLLPEVQRGGDRAKQATLLAINLIDWLTRSSELIALRAKRYTDRKIVDKAFKSDIEEIQEEAQSGDMSDRDLIERLNERYDEANERQKGRRSFWIAVNVVVPALLIIVVGFVVWILRAAMRARSGAVTAATAPTVAEKEAEQA